MQRPLRELETRERLPPASSLSINTDSAQAERRVLRGYLRSSPDSGTFEMRAKQGEMVSPGHTASDGRAWPKPSLDLIILPAPRGQEPVSFIPPTLPSAACRPHGSRGEGREGSDSVRTWIYSCEAWPFPQKSPIHLSEEGMGTEPKKMELRDFGRVS